MERIFYRLEDSVFFDKGAFVRTALDKGISVKHIDWFVNTKLKKFHNKFSDFIEI